MFQEFRGPSFAFQWTFSYIGFSVELNTQYFIGAHNIPNANMNDDSPSLSVNFTAPGKLPQSSVILSCWEACFGDVAWYRGQGTLDKAFDLTMSCNMDTTVTVPQRGGKIGGKPISVCQALC